MKTKNESRNTRSRSHERQIQRMVDEITLDVDLAAGSTETVMANDLAHFSHIIKSMKLDFQEKIDELRNELEKKPSREEIEDLMEFSNESDGNLNTTKMRKSIIVRSLLNGTKSLKIISPEEDDQHTLRHELEHDFFTLMMCTNVFSLTWLLGILAVGIQITLGTLTVLDQTSSKLLGTFLNIPISSQLDIQISQVLLIFLSVMSQTDLLVGLRNLYLLPYHKKEHWACIVELDVEQTFSLWFFRIFVPIFLKIGQGTLILFATFLIIVQSEETVDLLKDFSALFVISSVDDLFFLMAEVGYFGRNLAAKAQQINERSNIEIRESSPRDIQDLNRKLGYQQVLSLIAVNLIMLVSWIRITIGQENGLYLNQKYPLCIDSVSKNFTKTSIGNGVCNFQRHTGTNIIECGWDGEDCLELNDRFPNCVVDEFTRLGDGFCDDGDYNSATCGFDNGDCIDKNRKILDEFRNCPADKPGLLGNGFCDGGAYNTPECDFDFADCLNCVVDDVFKLQDGFCDGGFYSDDACSNDGGDCDNCFVDDFFKIGNGICDEGEYNKEGCSYDGGDCNPPAQRVGLEYRGIFKWWGAVLGENGMVYGIPYESNKILKYDPTTSSSSLVGVAVGTNSIDKWSGGVQGHDGIIYGVPYKFTSILRFDPVTEETSLIGEGHNLLSSTESKYGSGVVADNGIIYFIPYDKRRVVKFNASNTETPLVEIGDDLGNTLMKWWNGIIGIDGNIYCIPVKTERVLKINVLDDTTSFIGDGDPTATLMKYFGGTLASNGNIYACPYAASRILEINTQEGTTRLVGPDFGEGSVWCGNFVERDDGYLYGTPVLTTSIIRFDPVLETATLIPMDPEEFPQTKGELFEATNFKWGFPSVLGKDANIYAVPLTDHRILSVGPVITSNKNSTSTDAAA